MIPDFEKQKKEILGRFSSKKIVVLCGGTSGEREVSLRSGKKIHSALMRLGLNTELLDVKEDFIREIQNKDMDVAFVIFHGKPGEDGKIQGFLELMNIPYTGSGILASSIGMNKFISKMLFKAEGIPTPPGVFIYHYDNIPEKIPEISSLRFPLIVKPKDEGSSLGVEILDTPNPDETWMEAILSRKQEDFGDILIEEYIKGKIITVGILGTGREAFALPILELKPRTHKFYDYYAKYTKGETEFILPAEIDEKTTLRIQEYALKAHRILECRGFSRVDGVLSDDGKPFILEVNTLPGMTDLSDLPAEAEEFGFSYDDLIAFILGTIK